MRSRVICGTVVASLLLLAACAGSNDEENSVASSLARAATRSVVNAVIEIDNRSNKDEGQTRSSEPLRLAASRPDSILDIAGTTPDSSINLGSEASPAQPRHVVIATVLPDFSRKCGERRLEGDSLRIESASSTATVVCPLSRSRAGQLTRI